MLCNHSGFIINLEAQLVTRCIINIYYECMEVMQIIALNFYKDCASTLYTFAPNSLKCFGFLSKSKQKENTENALPPNHSQLKPKAKSILMTKTIYMLTVRQTAVCFQILFRGNNGTYCLKLIP